MTIAADDEGVAKTLAVLRQSAHHAFPPARSVAYAVEADARGFDITEDGRLLTRAPYPIDVLMVLDGHVYAPALAPYAGTNATLLNAACVRVAGGARLLLVGDRDVPRSALLLELLIAGAAVEGDWYVLLHDGLVTTLARSLRLQQEVADLLPEAAPLLAEQPYVQDALGRVVWSLDPAAAGYRWEIAADPVDAVVVVESNPGGHSRLERRPRHETAQEVVAAIGSVPGERGAPVGERIAAACRLVDACSCWRLRLGDLETAVSLLASIEYASGTD